MSSQTVLHYSTDQRSGLRRKRSGKGFIYTRNGVRICDARTIARIRKLAIPPAWSDVWINPSPKGHLQATGRDARGRKQYRYHAAFRAAREQDKFDHLTAFAKALPVIRRKVRKHLKQPGLTRDKVLATVVYLLERTLIRIGNEGYARDNGSFGLTTLRDPHVDITGDAMHFNFKGKSGKQWRLKISHPRVSKTVKACQDLPGQHLFQYKTAEGKGGSIASGDVNAYLRDISGQSITAKEFRTWAGTVYAALALERMPHCDSDTAAKKNVTAAVADVAERLGNTVAICRKCYVHPGIISAYVSNRVLRLNRAPSSTHAALSRDEMAVLKLLKAVES